jgi:2-polyprenyl-6-methoxyphenol hydroxylase-like FAD-dependent oxidoreductase
MSTFIVECDTATWHRAGLDRLADVESRAYCERLFAPDLGGYSLVSNKSSWRQFPLIANECWHSGNRVLLGDALRTVHFSIGSGTRLALEDAIALDRAIAGAGEDVTGALRTFEYARRPIVEKLLSAANASSYWYERLPEKMRLTPLALAYDYMMRSGRVTDERLREISPKFMTKLDEGRPSS